MRIRLFRFIVEETAKPHILKDCNLVIDAQNFFYDCYEKSAIHFEFGAECDRYARYLTDYLSMFKNANVKCYFIFKGGTKELERKIKKVLNTSYTDMQKSSSIDPIFMSDVHLQVLHEMKFEYMFSEYESKTDCMTLARRLSCPVVSNDIEFPLSGVQYIPKESIKSGKDQILRCKLFSPDNFLRTFRLDKNKVALFILLTDESIFPEKTFENFFNFRRIPLRNRNKILLQKLSNASEGEIINDILYTTKIAKELVFTELHNIQKMVRGEVNSEVATDYFFKNDELTDWFANGVANNYIAKGYIDVYRCKVLFRQLYDTADFMELSLNIIKYAFDLLTNFENDGLKVILFYPKSNTKKSKVLTNTIEKPACETENTIFQNGWDNINSFGLFQHFMLETIHFDCNKFETILDDAKMLMITLVYVLRNAIQPNITTFTTEMGYGVLLSYVMLGVVKGRVDNVYNDNSVTVSDCKSALHSLQDYFEFEDAFEIMDKNLLISLKQFQLCLSEMNNLNKLCGSPFKPTNYGKTYNGTFVYKVIYNMQNEGIIPSIDQTLSNAPTVLEYFHNIVQLYENLIQN